jgi:hypothetical protein
MSCSIQINRPRKPVHEVKYVPDESIDYYYDEEEVNE